MSERESLIGFKTMFEKAPDTKDAMKRYKSGKAGFTDIAHLKAKGLIKRADGTKKKSDKYKEEILDEKIAGLVKKSEKPKKAAAPKKSNVKKTEIGAKTKNTSPKVTATKKAASKKALAKKKTGKTAADKK